MSRSHPIADSPPSGHAIATVAGGCFWCLEALFEQVRGVVDVESGYANGRVLPTSYEAICTGQTGHAEVVRIAFDPDQISYAQLLEVFLAVHDPTTQDRQGADVGTQYRSAIFTHNADQLAQARACLERAAADFRDPIVTIVEPLALYQRAELYHQEYFRQHPGNGYCAVVIAPKVTQARAKLGGLLLPPR
jgi:peptide-methionine (S)-S-oxide reductase